MMDNPQDQSGAANPTNAGRNPQNQPVTSGTSRPTAGSPESTAAAARKSTATPTAQQTSPTSNNPNQAPTGAARPDEGQPANNPEGSFLDTAVQSGKKWIEDSGVLNSVNQLPQSLKDLGNRAAARVGDLSTTQKVVGGALLAVGLGWLATRKSRTEGGRAPYNYGPGNTGSYGRKKFGYQAPDATTSRPATNPSDSGSPYGSGSRYGGTSTSHDTNGPSFGASATTDHGSRTPDSRTQRSPEGLRRGTE